jgi:SAM-dependent methyltransferase
MRSTVREPRMLGRGCSTAEAGVVDYRLGRISSYLPIRGQWLDCGCAQGWYSAALKEAGADVVVGTDVEAPRIEEAARRWAALDGVSFLTTAAEDLQLGDESFDVVLLNEVLEHVADQQRTLAELRRVLVPDGRLVVFSPNRWFPFEGHGMIIGRLKVWYPIPLHPWLPQRLTARTMTARNYWPRQLAGIVRDAGFEILAVDFALPLFSKYEWLPRWVRGWYTRLFTRLDRIRLLRRFGVSTIIIARKPPTPTTSG